MARTASCRVANAFSTRLKLIWPKSSLKTAKMSKNAFFAKSSGSQWVKERKNDSFFIGLSFKFAEEPDPSMIKIMIDCYHFQVS